MHDEIGIREAAHDADGGGRERRLVPAVAGFRSSGALLVSHRDVAAIAEEPEVLGIVGAAILHGEDVVDLPGRAVQVANRPTLPA